MKSFGAAVQEVAGGTGEGVGRNARFIWEGTDSDGLRSDAKGFLAMYFRAH